MSCFASQIISGTAFTGEAELNEGGPGDPFHRRDGRRYRRLTQGLDVGNGSAGADENILGTVISYF